MLRTTLGYEWDQLVKSAKESKPLAFAQSADAFMVLLDRFTNDLTFGLRQAGGGITETSNGSCIKGERHFRRCHTYAILPYRKGSWSC